MSQRSLKDKSRFELQSLCKNFHNLLVVEKNMVRLVRVIKLITFINVQCDVYFCDRLLKS